MQIKAAKQIFATMRQKARPAPKLINAPADADGQPARIGDNGSKLSEVVISTNPNQEMSTIPAQKSIFIEAMPVDAAAPASTSSDVVEKEHFSQVPAKVDFLRNQGQRWRN
jgi:hypothetical protein